MAVNKGKSVALFATCLVDLWRPAVARAAERLLIKAGFKVAVPSGQTCCGQVNYNSGDQKGARKLARRHIMLLTPFDYVVVPSGSCADMIKNHYPALFGNDLDVQKTAQVLSGKTYELTEFLVRIARWKPSRAGGVKRKLVYHDSCSCQRSLRIYKEPRLLLEAQGKYDLQALTGEDRCCGFGGLFSVKYGEVSSHMAGKKTAAIAETEAEILTGADLGCLLNLSGKLKAEGSACEVRHIAEILAEEEA